MNVIFLAYRQWSIDVYESIQKHPKVSESILVTDGEELKALDLSRYDLLITCGWSQELGGDITSQIPAIGVHCAELDRYSYGTPLQLQINDGIKFSKHRVFSFTFDENSKRAHTHNRKYSHEVTLDLSGNMDDVLYQMTATSKVLFNMYLEDYPNITWHEWPEENIVRDKRVPKDSGLSKEAVNGMDTEQLYNFFRCLEAPYPNGYIEDEKGCLYIKKVEYKINAEAKKSGSKIVVCGYRDWAKEIIKQIEKLETVNVVRKFLSYEEYQSGIKGIPEDTSCILFLGWSWIVPGEITSRFLCLGIHPSDLPYYRGGSPIQHQIIDGLTESKVTLMTLSDKKLDGGDIWAQEHLDLTGDNINIVFEHIVESSVKMLAKFFEKFPGCEPIKQEPDKGSYYKRRKPGESRLQQKDFQEKSLTELYNSIRALTDPYPNAYIEDENGNKLLFKEVSFIPGKKNF